MGFVNRVEIAPAMLEWARARAGLGAGDLRKRFPKIEAWERGEAQPTPKQLEAFARITRTPIGYLFLDEPPGEPLPIADFRTIGGAAAGRPSPDLLDAVYLCQRRQDWYREEARTAGEPPPGFVGSMDAPASPAQAGARLREAIGFGIGRRRPAPAGTGALRQLIGLADGYGVLVMVSGAVGNDARRRLDPGEFRGFALADPLAPVAFVNASGAKAEWMFALAHGLARLWLGESGVSNADPATAGGRGSERWCGRVAAELLVPGEPLRAEFDPDNDLGAETARLAGRFGVSTLVVLRRIRDAGWLDRDAFGEAYREERERLRGMPAGGGGNYRHAGAGSGRRFARALIASAFEGRTTFTEAMRLLDVKSVRALRSLAESVGA